LKESSGDDEVVLHQQAELKATPEKEEIQEKPRRSIVGTTLRFFWRVGKFVWKWMITPVLGAVFY